MTPNLPKGRCIITGTSFDLPRVVQIDMIVNPPFLVPG